MSTQEKSREKRQNASKTSGETSNWKCSLMALNGLRKNMLPRFPGSSSSSFIHTYSVYFFTLIQLHLSPNFFYPRELWERDMVSGPAVAACSQFCKMAGNFFGFF